MKGATTTSAPPRPAFVVSFDGSEPAARVSAAGLDLRLEQALPLLGAILDFPRNVFEASEKGALLIYEEHLTECAHSIFLVPWPWPAGLIEYLQNGYKPVICVAVVSVHAAVRRACDEADFRFLEPNQIDVAVYQLWQQVMEEARSRGAEVLVPPPRGRTADVDSSLWGLYLPTVRVLRLFDVYKANADLVEQLAVTPRDLETAQNLAMSAQAQAQFQYDFVNPVNPARSPTQEEVKIGFREAVQTLRSPLILGTLPPAPNKMDKKTDELALHLLVAHRALASGGIGFTLNYPDSVWKQTEDLHRKLIASTRTTLGGPSWKEVQSRLKALGVSLLEEGGQALRDQLTHASWRGHVAVQTFSDLPLEWITMPDMSDPLCYVRPVVRRPVYPITAALQAEFMAPNITDLRDGLRITCFECMSPDDPVYKSASRIGSSLEQGLSEFQGVTIRRVAVQTKDQLLSSMRRHSSSNAFVVVAHGHADANGPGTALHVGEQDIVMPGELPFLPPLVVFSACNTSVRGGGWMNIADSALTRSARAVISAAVPIEAMRSQFLLVRFFRVLSTAIIGAAPHDTVLDVWHHVQATHVVHDILDSWPKLRSRYGDIEYEFKHVRSKGRLRTGHMIEDTITVLLDMADTMRFRGLRERLEAEGFFPESLFYNIAGWPDAIWASDPVTPRHRRRSRR